MTVNRRDFVKLGGVAALDISAGQLLRAQAETQAPASVQTAEPPQDAPKPDVVLRIAPVEVELTPNRVISTIGYNGTSPGPLLRMKEGKQVTVEVFNDTDVPEQVHWHGLLIPSEVDGTEEERTPSVPPHGSRRYQFVPRPAGSRWYHSHIMAGPDLHRATYTGQFGFVLVDSGNDPGNYDQEVFLALHEWEPFFAPEEEDDDSESGDMPGPQPERPAKFNTNPNGLEVGYQMFSINGRCLGAGEPLRVRPGQRILMHLLNASASENRNIALPGHKFHVIAMDGNPVPNPQSVEMLQMGPGERIDAIVEMSQPGVWVLGATSDAARNGGMGLVLEYANQHRQPQWAPPQKAVWDYTIFGGPAAQPAPNQTIEMVFEKIPSGAGLFNSWLVNGKPYPHENEFVLNQGARYRLVFRNRSEDAHPLHMHRHTFELVDINGKPTGGIRKDTVIVPTYGRVSVDMMASQPGLTLFHCHVQQHMDYGFKALFHYA